MLTRHYAWVRRSRILLLALAAAVIVGGVSLIGIGLGRDGTAGVLPLSGSSSSSTGPSTGPAQAPLARQERQRRVKALDVALKQYSATGPDFAVAVLDRKTGERYAYRGSKTYDTASVVKVQVLACLLLKAQAADRDLSANELALAQRMIRNSDNDATTALFGQLGQVSGVSRSNKRLGLKQTKVNTAWGLTRTTVNDQVRLLAELVDGKSPLDADSRTFAKGLMTTVAPDQRWGVSAAATADETIALKNGWDTRSADSGRWVVNSVGRITGDESDVSLAVLSRGHASQADGIAVVEKVAKLTRQHLKW
jgi:beta-lactamase class A